MIASHSAWGSRWFLRLSYRDVPLPWLGLREGLQNEVTELTGRTSRCNNGNELQSAGLESRADTYVGDNI